MMEKKTTAQENEEKIRSYKESQARAEALKNQVAQFNHETTVTITTLQERLKVMDGFAGPFSSQRNLASRLDLMRRSMVMLMSQLQSLSPKIYMVEDPVYPVLKKEKK